MSYAPGPHDRIARRPPEGAPLLRLAWHLTRLSWANLWLVLRPWQTVRDTGVNRYQEHARTGERRVQSAGGGYQPIDLEWLAGADGFLDPRSIRPPQSPGAVVPPSRATSIIDAERMTAMVNDAKATPIPAPDLHHKAISSVAGRHVHDCVDLDRALRSHDGCWVEVIFADGSRADARVHDASLSFAPIPVLDDIAADIMAARFVGPSGGSASVELLAMLRRRLLTDPPTVNASEIFADLGIDPDSPPPPRGKDLARQSSAMWARVREARLDP